MKTELRVMEDEKCVPRLLNTINYSSRFKNLDVRGLDLGTQEGQEEVARRIAAGWRQNGPWNSPRFLIRAISGDEVISEKWV